jgi:hypothetical protein
MAEDKMGTRKSSFLARNLMGIGTATKQAMMSRVEV